MELEETVMSFEQVQYLVSQGYRLNQTSDKVIYVEV